MLYIRTMHADGCVERAPAPVNSGQMKMKVNSLKLNVCLLFHFCKPISSVQIGFVILYQFSQLDLTLLPTDLTPHTDSPLHSLLREYQVPERPSSLRCWMCLDSTMTFFSLYSRLTFPHFTQLYGKFPNMDLVLIPRGRFRSS